MEALKEVTKWAVDYRQPNHTYLFDGERVVAYQKWHEGEPVVYSRREKLDKRGRKFIKADLNLFKNVLDKCVKR